MCMAFDEPKFNQIVWNVNYVLFYSFSKFYIEFVRNFRSFFSLHFSISQKYHEEFYLYSDAFQHAAVWLYSIPPEIIIKFQGE